MYLESILIDNILNLLTTLQKKVFLESYPVLFLKFLKN